MRAESRYYQNFKQRFISLPRRKDTKNHFLRLSALAVKNRKWKKKIESLRNLIALSCQNSPFNYIIRFWAGFIVFFILALSLRLFINHESNRSY